jgi:hypothetical protein
LLKFSRRQFEDRAPLLVFHKALRQRLGIDAAIGRYAVFWALQIEPPIDHLLIGRIDRIVDHFAGIAESHRSIRVAFARRETVAHGDHEHVFDGHIRIG